MEQLVTSRAMSRTAPSAAAPLISPATNAGTPCAESLDTACTPPPGHDFDSTPPRLALEEPYTSKRTRHDESDVGKQFEMSQEGKGTKKLKVIDNHNGARTEAANLSGASSVTDIAIFDNTPLSQKRLYQTAEEAELAFSALLEEKGVTVAMEWQEVMPLIINDKRYMALKTVQARKVMLERYQKGIERREADDKLKRIEVAENSFVALLKEQHSQVPFTTLSTWRQVLDRIDRDDRYLLFHDLTKDEDPTTFKMRENSAGKRRRYDPSTPARSVCEAVFNDFLYHLTKKDRKLQQKQRKKAQCDFLGLLQELGHAGLITATTSWRSLVEHVELTQDERFGGLSDQDRAEVFTAYLDKLKKEAVKERVQTTEDEKETQRKQRQAFRQLLQEKNQGGCLRGGKLSWSRFSELAADDERFVTMLSQSKKAAKSIYEDLCDELAAKSKAEKKFVKTIIKDLGISCADPGLDATFLLQQVKGHEDYDDLIHDASSLLAAIGDLLDSTKEKKKKKKKKK